MAVLQTRRVVRAQIQITQEETGRHTFLGGAAHFDTGHLRGHTGERWPDARQRKQRGWARQEAARCVEDRQLKHLPLRSSRTGRQGGHGWRRRRRRWWRLSYTCHPPVSGMARDREGIAVSHERVADGWSSTKVGFTEVTRGARMALRSGTDGAV